MTTQSRGRTRKGEESKAKMVEATAALLQRQGYNGTGLNQILAESGAPKGSLYFHFPGGKEQLACAAITTSGKRWEDKLRVVVDAAPDLASKVRAACATLGAELSGSGWVDGCPIATVALEAAASSPMVRDTCAAQYGAWQDMIAELIVEAGGDPTAAERFALFVLSTIEGALVLSRVQQDTRPLQVAGDVLADLVSGYVPSAT